MNRGTDLEKLRKAFEDQKNEDGGGGNYNWFKPQFGDNLIRILPPIDENNLFFHPTARHRVDGVFYYCLKYHTDPETGRSEKCPICEARTRLFRSGDKDLIKLAKDIKAKKQFLMNIVDRNEKDDPTKIFIFAAGIKIYNTIISSMLDDEIDITNVDEGYDFLVKKEEGPKMENGQTFPSYDNSKAKRKSTPLNEDPEVVQKILDGRNKLEAIPRFEEATYLEDAIQNFIQSLTGGNKTEETFYNDDNKQDPSQKAKSSVADFKKKLAESLKADDDADEEVE